MPDYQTGSLPPTKSKTASEPFSSEHLQPGFAPDFGFEGVDSGFEGGDPESGRPEVESANPADPHLRAECEVGSCTIRCFRSGVLKPGGPMYPPGISGQVQANPTLSTASMSAF